MDFAHALEKLHRIKMQDKINSLDKFIIIHVYMLLISSNCLVSSTFKICL